MRGVTCPCLHCTRAQLAIHHGHMLCARARVPTSIASYAQLHSHTLDPATHDTVLNHAVQDVPQHHTPLACHSSQSHRYRDRRDRDGDRDRDRDYDRGRDRDRDRCALLPHRISSTKHVAYSSVRCPSACTLRPQCLSWFCCISPM